MKYLMLSILILLLCICSAFSQTHDTVLTELNESQLQSMVANASTKLESYRLDMNIEQQLELINLSSNETQRLVTRSIGYGSVNMTDKSLKMVIASLVYAVGDEENIAPMVMEEYLQNDTIFLKTDGNWTSLKLPNVALAWSEQNTMENQVDMFNQSKLSLLGIENIDSQDCYKIRADIDMKTFADPLSEQLSSFAVEDELNYSDLFQNMNLSVNYWITKDTHFLKRTDVIESIVLTPQSLGVDSKGPEKQEMHLNVAMSVLFDDFNEKVDITVPDEAREALELSTIQPFNDRSTQAVFA